MEPNQRTTQATHKKMSKSKKTWIIILSIIVILAIAAGLYCWYMHRKEVPAVVTPQTCLQELQQLEAESAPVTATTTERVASLEALQKASKPVKTSNADRLAELQKLETSSQ